MTSIYRQGRIDSLQHEEYAFPYHYIPSPTGFPNFSVRWAFSASYLAAVQLAHEWFSSIPIRVDHQHMDFGCGDGGFIYALRQLETRDVQWKGVDRDRRAVSWAKAFSAMPEDFISGDIGDLDAGYLDSGTLIEVYEHVPKSECADFLRLIARSLRPGAPVFVTVPSKEKPLEPWHYRHFRFAELVEEFSEFFDVIDIFGFEKCSWLTKAILGLASNRAVHFESRPTNRFLVARFSRRHKELAGCGRIAMWVRKR